jgi:hypothetical protein
VFCTFEQFFDSASNSSQEIVELRWFFDVAKRADQTRTVFVTFSLRGANDRNRNVREARISFQLSEDVKTIALRRIQVEQNGVGLWPRNFFV